MRDPILTERTSSRDASPETRRRRPGRETASLPPRDFARWMDSHRDELALRWLDDLRARDAMWSEEIEAMVGRFLDLLVAMLPGVLGPYRNQVEPLWIRTAELFGSVAAQRGLAAGEAIEEFQLLRERLIRLLFRSPPVAGVGRMSLRDVLRLNRVVDQGVTHASVGHTDVLFFALFRGSGVPEALDAEVRAEVELQLDEIRAEFDTVMAALQS